MASQGTYQSSTSTSANSQNNLKTTNKLRIAWIHPNLGIGGAERLVVDSVLALQKRGHEVEVFTSFHQDGPNGRSFEETRNGQIKVHVLGDSIIPQSLFGGKFLIICAMLRQLHLTFSFLLSIFLYNLSFIPLFGSLVSLILIPLENEFKSSNDWSILRQTKSYDLIILDQLSTCIPILRWIGQHPLIFYCHFPDQLLSPSASLPYGPSTGRASNVMSLNSVIRNLYRLPINWLESITTNEADKILVNSKFTSEVFRNTFRSLNRLPRVVYPGIDVSSFGKKDEIIREEDEWLMSDVPTLLSINRFEGKKDVALAIDAFARARLNHPNLRLIIAGGYDSKQQDNVLTLQNLQSLAISQSLSHYTYSSSTIPSPTSTSTIFSTPPSPTSEQPAILFLLNLSSSQKSLLLNLNTTIALLYTPSYEHFGIVPLEAMASYLPVLATNSGGPTETIIDAGLEDGSTTGLLRIPSAESWSSAIVDLLQLSKNDRDRIGKEGRKRVEERFSMEILGRELEVASFEVVEKNLKEAIWSENGFIKALLFCFLGAFIGISGLVVYIVGS